MQCRRQSYNKPRPKLERKLPRTHVFCVFFFHRLFYFPAQLAGDFYIQRLLLDKPWSQVSTPLSPPIQAFIASLFFVARRVPFLVLLDFHRLGLKSSFVSLSAIMRKKCTERIRHPCRFCSPAEYQTKPPSLYQQR